MKATGALDHIGVYVKDLDKSLKFYTDIFGFPEEQRFSIGESKIVVLNIGGGLLELIQRPGAPAEPPKGSRTHVAFRIEKYDALLDKIEKMGIELRRVAIEGRSRIAFFKDPDGHDIEIMEKGLVQ